MCAGLGASAGDMADYLRRPIPGTWSYTEGLEQTLPTDDNWWQRFDDPLLDSLIVEGEEANFNLSEAGHRREIARLAMLQADSGYFPAFSASASYGRVRQQGVDANSFSLGADMSWEIDVFGKVSAGVKAKREAYRASRADYTSAMISVAAQIATYYIDYRVTQQHIAIAREHLESQSRVLEIAQARFEAGLASKLDVAQAKTVYYTTQTTLPQLEASLTQTVNALSTLLGVYPDTLEPRLTAPKPLPNYELLVPAGVPTDLLRRRPDIAAAEATLAQYAAEVGIAKKDFLPTLSLAGSIGVTSPKAKDLFKHQSFRYSIAPTLSWTIFDGFNRKYAVAQAKEQMMAGIDAYNLTVMTAVSEVNNALASYRSALLTYDYSKLSFEQSGEAFKLSVDQYKEGLSDFNNVMNAQIDWLNSANTMATAKGNALVSLIDLYKALGGSPTIE